MVYMNFFFFNYLLELNGAPTFFYIFLYTHETTTFTTVASGKEKTDNIKNTEKAIYVLENQNQYWAKHPLR
jgi:hypothetical protein